MTAKKDPPPPVLPDVTVVGDSPEQGAANQLETVTITYHRGANNPGTNNRKDPQSTNNTSTAECPVTKNPVILATGAKFKHERDIVAAGKYGMSLTRTYSSGKYGNLFGNRWLSGYDYSKLVRSGCFKHPDYPALCIPTSVVFSLSDGSRYTYTGTTLGNSDPFTYTVKGSTAAGTMNYYPTTGWSLVTPTATYTYSTAGIIQRIEEPGGALLVGFTYGADPTRPIQVRNAAGRAINFTYTNNLLTQATDSAGNVWNYTYNGNLLASVTSPGPSPDVRTYLYENTTVDPTLLTGILINGVRYSTYAYDSSSRVTSSTLTGGEQSDSFSYGSNSTTVTNASGETATYYFANIQGALKLQSTSRALSSTCAAGLASTQYDVNGWPSGSKDWNGNSNASSYDTGGNLLQQTSAVGTPAAITQVNSWAGTNLVGTTYLDAANVAYKSVAYTYPSSGYAIDQVATETWTDLRTGAQRHFSYGYAYQTNGVLISTTKTIALPGGNATTTSNYDAIGNLVSVVNPLGQQVSWSGYNGLGQPGKMTDANGVSTDYTYDAKGT